MNFSKSKIYCPRKFLAIYVILASHSLLATVCFYFSYYATLWPNAPKTDSCCNSNLCVDRFIDKPADNYFKNCDCSIRVY